MNFRKFYLDRTIALIIVIVLAWVYFAFIKSKPMVNQNTNDNQIVCTAEAKQCGDGSYVSRTGQNCEFTACPEELMDYTGWLAGTDSQAQIAFQYPPSLSAHYISSATWPPKLSVSDEAYACQPVEATSPSFTQTTQRQLENRKYCITRSTEGAAGSEVTTYHYTTLWQNKLVSFDLILNYPRCENYDQPQQAECQAERQTFDLDALVDKIALSVKFLPL